jgi:hypothetical protein
LAGQAGRIGGKMSSGKKWAEKNGRGRKMGAGKMGAGKMGTEKMGTEKGCSGSKKEKKIREPEEGGRVRPSPLFWSARKT